MILIVGVTGLLGRATALQLREAGQPVRGLARTPQNAADLEQRGVEVVQGDLLDPTSLARACQGVDAVLSASHGMLGRGKYRSEMVDDVGHRALIDAARAAGTNHFVYTSVLGAAPEHPVDFWRTKYRIEQYLKASGLSYTVLRPSAFLEVHAHQFLGKSILERGKTTILGHGNNPTNFVAVQDVARFAVLALTDPGYRGTIVEIGGPDNLTKNEVAQLYGQLAHRTPRVRHVSPRTLRVLSALLRPVHPGISRILHVSAVADTTEQTFDPAPMLANYPVVPMSVRDFVRERVAEAGLP